MNNRRLIIFILLVLLAFGSWLLYSAYTERRGSEPKNTTLPEKTSLTTHANSQPMVLAGHPFEIAYNPDLVISSSIKERINKDLSTYFSASDIVSRIQYPKHLESDIPKSIDGQLDLLEVRPHHVSRLQAEVFLNGTVFVQAGDTRRFVIVKEELVNFYTQLDQRAREIRALQEFIQEINSGSLNDHRDIEAFFWSSTGDLNWSKQDYENQLVSLKTHKLVEQTPGLVFEEKIGKRTYLLSPLNLTNRISGDITTEVNVIYDKGRWQFLVH